MLEMCHFLGLESSFHSKDGKDGQSYSGFPSHQPSLTLLCVLVPGSGSPQCCTLLFFFLVYREEPVPETSLVLFLYFIFCLKKKKKVICCLSVFKIGGGRLGDCLCVVALVYSSYVLYLNFSDDLHLVVRTRQSSPPNAVVGQSGQRLASRLPV